LRVSYLCQKIIQVNVNHDGRCAGRENKMNLKTNYNNTCRPFPNGEMDCAGKSGVACCTTTTYYI